MRRARFCYYYMNNTSISKSLEFLLRRVRTVSCSASCLRCCALLTTHRDKIPPMLGSLCSAPSAPKAAFEVFRQMLLVADLHTNDSPRFIQPLPSLRRGVRKEKSQKTIADEKWNSFCTKTLCISLISLMKMKRCPKELWVHQKEKPEACLNLDYWNTHEILNQYSRERSEDISPEWTRQ
jgi:hypothetical protein